MAGAAAAVTGKGTSERHATVFAEGKCLAVQLMAVVFPDEQAEALRQQKQARDNGTRLSEPSGDYPARKTVRRSGP
jgi:hypothetical protein